MDEQTNTIGDQVYVPLDFYNVLQQQTEASRRVIDGWRLLSASYQSRLRTDPVNGTCTEESFRAVFEFEIVEPECLLTIPLGSREWEPIMDALRLDGEFVPGSWQFSDATLRILVTRPGRVVLEVPMRSTPRNVAGRLVCEGRIPPIPDATFDLEIADERGLDFEVPSALGPDAVEERGRHRWLLGATDRLVRGHNAKISSLEFVGENTELDEVGLISVLPDGVFTDLRWTFRNLPSPLNRFAVRCPAGLEMTTLRSETGNGTIVRTREGYLGEFIRPITSDAPVYATFRISPVTPSGLSGIGRWRIPEISVYPVRVARRKLSIAMSPELELTFSPNEPIRDAHGETLPTDALPPSIASSSTRIRTGIDTTGTGGTVSTIGGVAGLSRTGASSVFSGPYDRDQIPDDLILTVRMKPEQTHVEQRMICNCQRDRVQIETMAKIRVLSGAVFQYQIEAPAELKIESLRIQEENVVVPARWARTATGRITLFPDAPAATGQEIVLRGWIPISCPGEWTVPHIRVSGTSRSPDVVEIFGREAVRVAVRTAKGLEVVDSAGTGSRENAFALGRFVAAYREIPRKNATETPDVRTSGSSIRSPATEGSPAT
ncbi:MAG: hypothetical protein Q4C47_09050, partial [Planctomycetia bacterium]|nr:hypothetical protein [Planctomycetia bacterium]